MTLTEYVQNDAFIPNIWQLQITAKGRYLYAKTLRTIGKKYNLKQLFTLAKKLESTMPMWSVIIGLLTKIYVSKDLRLTKRLEDKLYEVADYEENIYNSLRKFYPGL